MYVLAIGNARESVVMAIPVPDVLSVGNCLEIFPPLFQVVGLKAHIFGVVEYIGDKHPQDFPEVAFAALMSQAKQRCAKDPTGKATLVFNAIIAICREKGIAFRTATDQEEREAA